MRTVLVGLALAFGLGGCLGSNMADEPPPEFIEVPHTKIIEAPAPDPVEVSVVPESCLQAMALTDTISRQADKMYTHGDEQLAIISDARQAIAGGNDLNVIANRQRSLQGDTVNNLYSASEAIMKFTAVYNECKKE